MHQILNRSFFYETTGTAGLNAGELTTAQLKNMQVAEKDVPEVIGIKAAETSKLANRLREQKMIYIHLFIKIKMAITRCFAFHIL